MLPEKVRPSFKPSRLKGWLGALAVNLLLANSACAPGPETAPAQVSAAELSAFTQELGTLVEQLKNLPRAPGGWSPENKQPVVEKIDASITGYILQRLNSSRRPPAETLAQELNEALTRSIVGASPEEIKKSNPSFRPFAFALENPDEPQLYAVGYAIGFGHAYDCVVRAFVRRSGRYVMMARAETDFGNRILEAVRLKSFQPAELRFLVYGSWLGSPQGLLKVVLYRFDGNALQALWEKDRLIRGEVSLQNGQVLLYYWPEQDPRKPPLYHREIYQQTPEGLKLEKVESGPVR